MVRCGNLSWADTEYFYKIRPDGGALAPILEAWINGIQNQVAQDTGMRPNNDGLMTKLNQNSRSSEEWKA